MTIGVPETDIRSCRADYATEEKLKAITAHNLESLERMIKYNIRNDIRLFRISSDLVPFGSSPVNRLPWWEIFGSQLAVIGEKLREGNIRVSMHPGQYTVLNSPDESVVRRAVLDLEYHAKVLDALNTDAECKIVLHVGGVYGNKKLATERFVKNYNKINEDVKQRIVIENDDRSYTIEDVLQIGSYLQIPVVFDLLHHQVNPCGTPEREDVFWIGEAGKTWRREDGTQKIHYSQQEKGKRPGSHSASIETDDFLSFFRTVSGLDVDIMLEVKDKNLSAVKCINLISAEKEIKNLELEWSRYKYAVLELSPEGYTEIRTLLRNKSGYPAAEFYRILEASLKKNPDVGKAINAAQHVWGYFKYHATIKEKERFQRCVEDCMQGKSDIKMLKRILRKLAEKYQEPYLMNSYYFR
jgi:UV DNA damage endonuclease